MDPDRIGDRDGPWGNDIDIDDDDDDIDDDDIDWRLPELLPRRRAIDDDMDDDDDDTDDEDEGIPRLLPWHRRHNDVDDSSDDGDDSSSVEDGDGVPRRMSCDLRSGTVLLERERQAVLSLRVAIDRPAPAGLALAGWGVPHNNNRRGWFGRFVSALRGSGTVRTLTFLRGSFVVVDDDEENENEEEGGGAVGEGGDVDRNSPRQRDLVALFGEVLPRHPTLTEICLSQCDVDPAHLRRFFRSLPSAGEGPGAASALARLHLRKIPLSTECCDALGDALQRNVRVETLRLSECRLDSSRCRRVCEGAARSAHLQVLDVSDRETLVIEGDDTFRDLLASPRCARLATLAVHARSWEPSGYRAFLKGLRTNRTITTLSLGGFGGGSSLDRSIVIEDMEDLLRWHNWTLSGVRLTPEPRQAAPMASVRALLDRNNAIRRCAVPALVEREFRVSPPSLWPIAMDKVGTVPSLLYPLLRRGNLQDLAERVASAAATATETDSSSSSSSPPAGALPADAAAAT